MLLNFIIVQQGGQEVQSVTKLHYCKMLLNFITVCKAKQREKNTQLVAEHRGTDDDSEFLLMIESIVR